MPRKFDPDKQCGAPTKSGKPCTQPKGFGTIHVGEGLCHLHCSPDEKAAKSEELAGASRPAIESQLAAPAPAPPPRRNYPSIAPRNARPRNNCAVTHGLYRKVLTGQALARYEAVAEHDPGDILRSNFALIQSKLLGIVEGDVKYDKQSEVLLQAAQILMEEGELEEAFVDELRLKLVNFDTARLAGVFNSTVSLANASIALDRLGVLQAQHSVLMNFLRMALRMGDRNIRQAGLETLQLLKLEGGAPVELIEEILVMLKEELRSAQVEETENAQEETGETIEAESEDVLGEGESTDDD